ncbi:MAG: hypothetical protein HQ581_11085, partial [Planctomycetes bacterium]|nr:hypothetical protein [Planctomycetota bacterium]
MPRTKSFSRIRYAALGVAIAGIVGLVLFVRSEISEARRDAERSACTGHLAYLTADLNSYYLTNGTFPPAYVEDENGRRMHSWRVLIRPYFNDSTSLAYDFDKAWDHPDNTIVPSKEFEVQRIYDAYVCPSDDNALAQGFTNYVAIVGKNTLWPGKEGYKPISRYDFAYGKNTFDPNSKATPASVSEKDMILLIELPESDIVWAEPRDLTVEEAVNLYRERKRGEYRTGHVQYITLSGKSGDIVDIPDEETFRNMCGDGKGGRKRGDGKGGDGKGDITDFGT